MATFVVPFTVRDSGYALMVLLIAGVAAALAWRRGGARLTWVAPLRRDPDRSDDPAHPGRCKRGAHRSSGPDRRDAARPE
ncbi:hypothetical protein ACRAWD_27375 [Caulobacter segnis]